ncbi:HlyD family secretion protein [Flavilitoribacter nigricans]|uniref:RND efflux pump membrane fusion protein barrel-sandwich domain-containing protein n=1 Tax=Flavilitoribacter nigricans (strain ATCC 23147 / DSM 23189 / NBRC 102662 / NCIMB 1420 / SS-2) TaxID=1122177 RepID=A0A2D0N1X4_FLAN2|nr:hypothetical protein [Flavilitoribacter nigricans]PHN02430.1 hypothetical protein CRP01_32120 [Flavilitoribacter nigricans DSM 23189 = NBRC 102662]
MRSINLFYVAIVAVGLSLWAFNRYYNQEVALFYGFAETKETEINFNYPVAVASILVHPGQTVKAGTPLLQLQRIKSKETMEDQGFKMAELRAEEQSWLAEQENRISLLEQEQILELESIKDEIQKLEEQKQFQNSLYEDLQSVRPNQTDYQPVTTRINTLKKEHSLLSAGYAEEINGIKEKIRLGKNPYRIAIDRLEAERDFDRANQVVDIELTAPQDGLIGNIHCKEAEHIPAYNTLVTFYEPNPTLVKGYVHEDLILEVALQDTFIVRSTKDEGISCYGVVSGLGSRIVEIPERMRKVPEMKTYGREVLVSITPDNRFLQKEKVVLEFLHPLEKRTASRSELVELKGTE